jgi:hypothetical protein
VNDRREPDDARPHTVVGEGDHVVLSARDRDAFGDEVGFGAWAVVDAHHGQHQRPADADERLTTAIQRGAHGLDGLAVPDRSAFNVAGIYQVVPEGQVDDAARLTACFGEDVEVVEAAAYDLRAGDGELVGRGVRAGQAEDLVTGTQQSGTRAAPM